MKNAIVLVIDRLNASFLGPYGNTWVETPCFNRLAAESALFEFALSDSPHLPTIYRSMWSGLHAMSEPRRAAGLAELAAAADVHTVLITDEDQVASHPLATGFDEQIMVPTPPITAAADEIGDTQLARLFGSAISWLQAEFARPSSSRHPFLLWIHSRGMQAPWDAPLEFRRSFADVEDPVPPDFVEPPIRWVLKDEDPDHVLGIQHAYAGQISLLDACLDVFLDARHAEGADREGLLLLTSSRGYALGEHGRIGPVDQTLYGEHLHVPCLAQYPEGREAMTRCHQLVQPSDLYATVLDWWNLPRPGASQWGNSLTHLLSGAVRSDRAGAISDTCRALRTAAWYLLSPGDTQPELFAKPDDRWEANEVSDRCREVMPELVAVLDEFQQAASAAGVAHLSELPQSIASSDH
jgi:arylsulfatase A-like enzyme